MVSDKNPEMILDIATGTGDLAISNAGEAFAVGETRRVVRLRSWVPSASSSVIRSRSKSPFKHVLNDMHPKYVPSFNALYSSRVLPPSKRSRIVGVETMSSIAGTRVVPSLVGRSRCEITPSRSRESCSLRNSCFCAQNGGSQSMLKILKKKMIWLLCVMNLGRCVLASLLL